MCKNLNLADNAQATNSLDYVEFLRFCDTLHLLSNIEYWFEKLMFEQRFRVWRGETSLVNWHCVNIFGVLTGDRKVLSVHVSL